MYVIVEPLERRLALSVVPPGFYESLVAGNLGSPTAMDLLPDGRVLVATQAGDLRVIENGGLLPTPFVHLAVDSSGERGLLGVTHDPNFGANHFVYLCHTVTAAGGAKAFNEITRYVANGDVALPGSAVDILRLNDLSSATNHNGGAMHFGADGLLYVGVGENANPANAQTLGNLLGKILRIDVSQIQSGDPVNDVAKLVPASNPFVGTATGINGAIYALGFRNPFTFAVNPATGGIFVNDVGQNTSEEIDPLFAGRNYGWSKAEGFAFPTPPAGLGPGTYQDPVLAYDHSGGPAGGGVAIVGGAFYVPPNGAAHPFPAAFNGRYFYADLGDNWIRTFDPATSGTQGNPDPSATFANGTVDNPVDLAVAPDGSLYYLARGNGGVLMRIAVNDVNAPQITVQPAATTVSAGHAAVFTVSASGAGTLTYQWQRNNGPSGTFVDVSGANAATYVLHPQRSDSGAQFRAIVSSGFGSAISDAATLNVTLNHPPKAKIVSTGGLFHGKFSAGTPIDVSFFGTDKEDGVVASVTYQVDYLTSLNAVPGGVVRPFVPATTGVAAAEFTPEAQGPYTLTDVRYRVTLTVTDFGGLSTTVTRDFRPRTARITLRTSPARLPVNVDGQSRSTPFSFSSVVGFTQHLDAPIDQVLGGSMYSFASWSDGGAAAHDVTTPARGATYVANYLLS